MTESKRLYTAPEMAEELGYSPNGVYLQLNKRQIQPAHKTGSIRLYSAETLDQLRKLMDPRRRAAQKKPAKAMRAAAAKPVGARS